MGRISEDNLLLRIGFRLSGKKRTFVRGNAIGLRTMNGIDIGVGLVMIWAVVAGLRRGAVMQLVSLAGLAAGIWLAARYGTEAGHLLSFGPEWVRAGGFVTVLVVAMIVIGLLGQLLRRLFSAAGFGSLDRMLGIAVSAAKWLLILSILFAVLRKVDPEHSILPEQVAAESVTYRPVSRIAEALLPFLDRIPPINGRTAPATPETERI